MASDVLQEKGNTKSSLNLLYHISRELASALELRLVLQRVLKLSLENAAGASGTLIVLDDSGNALDSIIVVNDKVIEETTEQLRFTLDQGLAGWVAKRRKAALVRDTSKDKRWQSRPVKEGGKSEPKSTVSAPLIVRDELVGVITLTHPEINYFSESHLELLQAIADQAAFAVLNARLYSESQRRAHIMSAIAESAAAITASLDIDEVLQTILKQITEALNVEAVSLALVEDDKDTIVFRAATGEKSKDVIGLSIGVGQGIAGWVVKKGQAVIVQDAHNDPRFYASMDQNTGYRTRSIACAPIRSKDKLVGVLEAINPIDRTFNDGDLIVLEGIGNLAGAAIEHAQLFEQVENARSRYRELFEDSVDPIIITDLEGNITEANLQAESLTGFKKKQLYSMNVHHFHQADWKSLGTDLENVMSGESISYESALHKAGDPEIHVEVYVHQIEMDGTKQLQWIFRDITERNNLDNLREDLASMIYHDLRSPLANVVSGLDVLEMMLPANEDPTIRSVLDIAMRSTERVQRLATSLLDTSRMEAGQTVGNPEPTVFVNLVKEAIEANLPFAEAKNVGIETSLPKNLPKVVADSEMIKRVIINLIENALKYSEENSKVIIGAKREGDWVRAWVKDEGRGIPKEEQDRIFDKFTRVRKGSTGNTAGLGLGLAYCKLAIEGHGGKIWVESENEKGSKFTFTVPII